MMNSERQPFVTNDRSAALRDARRRSSQQRIEYFLGVRESTNDDVEYIVAPDGDFLALHDEGGWLYDESYGAPITPDDLTAAYVCGDMDEAMLDATMRITAGAPALFIALREGGYLVAPLVDWPRFAKVGWQKIAQFAQAGS